MKNNKNKNNSIPISPPAPAASSLPSSPEPKNIVLPENPVPATSAASLPSSPEPTVPDKIYPNSDTCKAQILSENKNKSGIYMWTNLIDGKQYIGSAIDLPNRLDFIILLRLWKIT